MIISVNILGQAIRYFILNSLFITTIIFIQPLLVGKCHGTGAMATKRMYLRSLQDVARSIVRVEGVRR